MTINLQEINAKNLTMCRMEEMAGLLYDIAISEITQIIKKNTKAIVENIYPVWYNGCIQVCLWD